MQISVPLVADLKEENAEILSLYGIDRPESTDFGRACLLCAAAPGTGCPVRAGLLRRNLRQPARNWDGHENMKVNHEQEAGRIDRPIAGLLRDFRRRGLLDDTLILLTTEFGRTPFSQSGNGLGRPGPRS